MTLNCRPSVSTSKVHRLQACANTCGFYAALWDGTQGLLIHFRKALYQRATPSVPHYVKIDFCFVDFCLIFIYVSLPGQGGLTCLLELEFHVVVSRVIWMLESEVGSSGRAARALNH